MTELRSAAAHQMLATQILADMLAKVDIPHVGVMNTQSRCIPIAMPSHVQHLSNSWIGAEKGVKPGHDRLSAIELVDWERVAENCAAHNDLSVWRQRKLPASILQVVDVEHLHSAICLTISQSIVVVFYASHVRAHSQKEIT